MNCSLAAITIQRKWLWPSSCSPYWALYISKNISILRLTFQLVSPMCLFYLNSKGTLLPVAIQLFSKPGPENPVREPMCWRDLFSVGVEFGCPMWSCLLQMTLHRHQCTFCVSFQGVLSIWWSQRLDLGEDVVQRGRIEFSPRGGSFRWSKIWTTSIKTEIITTVLFTLLKKIILYCCRHWFWRSNSLSNGGSMHCHPQMFGSKPSSFQITGSSLFLLVCHQSVSCQRH